VKQVSHKKTPSPVVMDQYFFLNTLSTGKKIKNIQHPDHPLHWVHDTSPLRFGRALGSAEIL
jgi:hypothetical protein